VSALCAPAEDRPTAVYRFYDGEERLLYVGITFSLGLRFAQHERGSEWWRHQRSVKVVWRESRTLAAAEERAALRSEKPIHNKSGTRPQRTKRVRLDEKARRAIATEVRAEVARSGKSKQQVREFLGISRQAAWQRMVGVTSFPDDELAELAEFLGIPVSRFLPPLAVAA
jgi:predicted GIY-YIG superfamily endonuclease